MLFTILELPNVLATIIISNTSCTFDLVLAKQTFVLELISHLQSTVTVKLLIFESTFIYFSLICSHSLSQSYLIISKLSLVFYSVSHLEYTMSMRFSIMKNTLIIVSIRPSYSSITFTNAVDEISLIGPACFVLYFCFSSEQSDRLGYFQTIILLGRIPLKIVWLLIFLFFLLRSDFLLCILLRFAIFCVWQNIDDGSSLYMFDEGGVIVLLFFTIFAHLLVTHRLCYSKEINY